MPDYNYHFDRDDHETALACLDEHGFCVIRGMIDREMVASLKASIDRHLDPAGDLGPASNRYHMTFAEASEEVWELVDNPAFMRFLRLVHGTADLCLHRSAAILRTPGEAWAAGTRTTGGTSPARSAPMTCSTAFPSPAASGSTSTAAIRPQRHRRHRAVPLPPWLGRPEGYAIGPDRGGLHPEGAAEAPYDAMAVPGCVPVLADPGDLICFAALTWHANMATRERRYSCGIGFRPRSFRIDAPWPLPASARAPGREAARAAQALHGRLRRFRRGVAGRVGRQGSAPLRRGARTGSRRSSSPRRGSRRREAPSSPPPARPLKSAS